MRGQRDNFLCAIKFPYCLCVNWVSHDAKEESKLNKEILPLGTPCVLSDGYSATICFRTSSNVVFNDAFLSK